MNILGIETSCDETAAAIVQDGTILLSNTVASQIDLHVEFGGVVPEIAARSHVEVILPVIQKTLKDAGCDWDEIDGIAVATGPGLIGSLLIGTLTARTLAHLKNKPLYAINHVEAHVYAAFLRGEGRVASSENLSPPSTPAPHPSPLAFPLLALIVSGGHTQLVLFTAHGDYRLLGQTKDDAAGEAFDKVARILGLPYPGGPSISKAAEFGNPTSYLLPHPKLGKESLDFSFSGLKTAVLRLGQSLAGADHRMPSHELSARLSAKQKHNIAASFQQTVVDILIGRLKQACATHKPQSVVICGGVAANTLLRHQAATQLPLFPVVPTINLCTDNAAMIASLGYFQAKAGKKADPSTLSPNPILSM